VARIGRWAPWLGFAAGFLAVGIPYWSIPYREADLPSALPAAGLAVVAVVAAVLRASGAARLGRIVAVVGASVPAAVLARVAVETDRDPTSHNLWPFEIAIALGVGFAWALAGALVGLLAARLRGGRTA
jgi:hypothetical protein